MKKLAAALLWTASAFACTEIKLIAKDGSVVHGRTAEFGVKIDFSLLEIPRNYAFTGSTPSGAGMSYTSKYGAIGVMAFDTPGVMDGLNEKGLAVGVFYFPNYAEYAEITDENISQALSPIDFSNWLLTQFASVDEIPEALAGVVIAPTVINGWGPTPPPFHYIVIDKTGKSLVIEPIGGKLIVHENPLGIITNSPTFDWHMTHLTQFINLTPYNVSPITAGGVKFIPFGEGSGLVGLPGDFSPPSRFVRAAIFSLTAIPSPTSPESVLQAFHILNQFDIPLGAIRSVEHGVTYTDQTLATTVRDPQTLRYYFRTYEDQSIKMADLNKFDLNAPKLKRTAITGKQPIQDISGSLK